MKDRGMGAVESDWPGRMLLFLLGLLAALRLGRAFFRLLLDPSPTGAIDLKLRHAETLLWFSGRDVYSLPRLTYPPATYTLLGPLIGWCNLDTARVVWTLLSVLLTLSLAWMVHSMMGREPVQRRIFGTVCVLASSSLSTTIGNGQLSLLVLMPLFLLLSPSLKNRGLASLLVVLMLIKPSSSLPLLWLFMLPGHVLTIVLSSGLYLFLTLLSVHFQEAGLLTLLNQWLEQTISNLQSPGYANLISLGRISTLEGAGQVVGVVLCLGVGIFVLRFGGKRDLWLSAGILGIVARIWTYHRIYDDLLILPALMALYRHETSDRLCPGHSREGWILLSLGLFSLLAPGHLRLLGAPWGPLYEIWQLLVWGCLLLYLCVALLPRER